MERHGRLLSRVNIQYIVQIGLLLKVRGGTLPKLLWTVGITGKLGLNIFPAGAWFKSLVKELRFCKHVAHQK